MPVVACYTRSILRGHTSYWQTIPHHLLRSMPDVVGSSLPSALEHDATALKPSGSLTIADRKPLPTDRKMFVPSVYLHTYGLPTVSRQGKVAELRQELNFGGKKDKNHAAKKIALKKIVANMTMSNNDMVALFPDVVACMDIQSLEIKKM